MATPQAFLDESRRFLSGQYVPKIVRCLEMLDDDEIWWRPNEQCNSVGNLVLHLAGNVRQYLVSGVGGVEDIRQRDAEFAAKDGHGANELITMLQATVAEVDRVLAQLDPSELDATRTIQGRSMTVLRAIYHAVEHFSMHTGQIIYVTKQLRDTDLEFYRFRDGTFKEDW